MTKRHPPKRARRNVARPVASLVVHVLHHARRAATATERRELHATAQHLLCILVMLEAQAGLLRHGA